jgi:hypothetical protein
MRVLVDESLPKALGRTLVGHQVWTVRQVRWDGLKNGELIRRAVAEGFDAPVTMDRSIEHQQKVPQLGLGVVVMRAPSNRIEHVVPLAPEVLRALETLRPGQVVFVGA